MGQLVVKRILPHQDEAKGKFSPYWQGPYVIKQVLFKGALQLVDMEGMTIDTIVNADSVKKYYSTPCHFYDERIKMYPILSQTPLVWCFF